MVPKLATRWSHARGKNYLKVVPSKWQTTSWAQVALALGVTAQAAHKRYRWLHHSPATDETWHEPPLSC